MGNLVHLRGDPHGETQKLLPWYVVDRLDPADRMIVEAHLAECAECRADLAGERRVRDTVADIPIEPVMETDSGWERLAASLAERPAPVPAADLPRIELRRKRPARLGWFLAAQAAVVVLAVGALLQHRPEPATYHALGATPAPHTGNILVMFGPATRERDLRRALEASHARLVDGPTATGAYVLSAAPERRAAAVAILRAQSGVTLAEPIDAAP